MVVASGDEAVAAVRANKEKELRVSLTPKQVVQLAKALDTNSTLTTLDLYCKACYFSLLNLFALDVHSK